jgi:hypothetical protein
MRAEEIVRAELAAWGRNDVDEVITLQPPDPVARLTLVHHHRTNVAYM